MSKTEWQYAYEMLMEELNREPKELEVEDFMEAMDESQMDLELCDFAGIDPSFDDLEDQMFNLAACSVSLTIAAMLAYTDNVNIWFYLNLSAAGLNAAVAYSCKESE